MRERLFSQRNLARKLSLLLVLFALVFMPLGAWAVDYPFLIGTARLTSDNMNTGDFKGITYDATNNRLTLEKVNLTVPITWDGSRNTYGEEGKNLSIVIVGDNKITTTGTQSCFIMNRTDTGYGNGIELNFKGSIENESSLTLICDKANDPFPHDTQEELRPISSQFYNSTFYDNAGKIDTHLHGVYWKREDGSETVTYKFEAYYGYIVAGVPVTEANRTGVTGSNIKGTVTLDQTTNDLILENADISGSIYCEPYNDSNTSTIIIKGKNSIESTSEPCIFGQDDNQGQLAYLSIARGADYTEDCYLTLDSDNNNAISGFRGNPSLGEGLVWVPGENPQSASVATRYDLTVAGVQVNSANASDILKGTGYTGEVSFEPASSTNNNVNTLTLNGAELKDDGIESGLANLTIHLKGTENYIGTQASPQLEKGISSTVSTAKLTFTSEIDVNDNNRPTGKLYFPYVTTPIDGFSDIVYENGLEYALVDVYLLGGIVPCVGEILYGLTIGDTQVTSANYSPIKNGDGNSINASYNKDTHTLTLDGATLTKTIEWETDADFTIELKGNNSIKFELDGTCISSTKARNITFTRGDATKPCSLQLSTETPSTVIDGFANSGNPTMGTGLSWIVEESSNSNVTKAAVAEYYNVDVGNNTKVHSGNASDVLGDGKVSYNVESNTLTLKDGATISPLGINYFGTTDLTIAIDGTVSVTGSTYALNTNSGKLNFVKASGATSAELTATCGDGYTPPISFYSSSLGDGLYWALTTPASTSSIIITDDDSKVLLAPTIAFDTDKDYFATDKIAITRNTNDAISTDIFYTWGNAEIGTLYVDTVPKALAKYDATNQIPVKNGTLRAWVGFQYGTDEYVLSLVASQAFTVKTDISKCAVEGLSTTKNYTGSNVEPTFTVTDNTNNKTLTKDTDYTVAYYKVVNKVAGNTPVDMIEVGEYQIVISGKGDYAGKIEKPFEITKANLSIVTIEAIKDQTYTGSEIKPEIKVTLNNVTLTPDDYGYTVGYSNNTNVPASGATSGPTVTLTALAASKYFTEGTTKTAAFNIVPKSIEGVTVTLSGVGFDSDKKCFVYNGQNQTPTVTVKDGNNLLVLDTDYTLTNNGGVGVADDYLVTVKGKGNYDESTSVDVTYSIAPRSIKETNVNLDATVTYVYTGGEHKPEPVVKFGDTKLVKDQDYTLSYSNNINAAASTAENAPTVTITGKGDFDENTTTTVKFTIGQADLAEAAISKISFGGTDYTAGNAAIEIPYTGEAIHPTVKEVKYKNGTVTLDASEYTVSWGDNNTELSSGNESAQVIITSTGKNFTAGTSTSLNFKIVAANVTITAPDQTVTYNGSAQAYTSATVDNTKATLAVAYYTKEDDRTKGSNALAGAPTDAGTYYVQVTQTDGHYTANAMNATFTIDQLSLTGAVITLDEDELIYDGTEQTVSVTKVMVGTIEVPATNYDVSGNKQTDPGDYTLTVTAKANEGTFKNNFKGSATAVYTIKRNTAVINFPAGLTYMTYYNANTDYFIPDGVTAYIVTGTDGTKVTVTKVSYLKAGVPLLLEKTDGSTIVMDPNDSFDGNKLVYVSSDLTTSSRQYVLYNNEFVKASGTIPAGKVYLEVDNTSSARVLTIGEGTTGIDNLRFDNSQIDNCYDLQGRRIDKPTKKGLYILNGKKIVIK